MFGIRKRICQALEKKRRGAVTTQYVIAALFGAYLAANILPEIITAIQSVNTSAWTFTGHAGAAAIWGMAGLMIVVAVVRRLIAD